ncbi:MAG: exopolysaccharide biosynthesis protein, partial [Lachnospiraceae bacterium]|nr:exopolysaccharide biosynthesis protein [Lachnospiraceae bacterium]
MIPKVIHYCWFGGNPKPEIIESCIASWRKFCPDWEIIEWNENNFDVRRYTFMSEAYDAGKWAFVSDVARLMIIYEYGGIYLDTDVELRMSLEQVSRFNAFFAYDNLVNINTGIGFGAVPEHPYIQAMLESYADQHFDAHHVVACPKLNTDALRSCCPDWVVNGNETQC